MSSVNKWPKRLLLKCAMEEKAVNIYDFPVMLAEISGNGINMVKAVGTVRAGIGGKHGNKLEAIYLVKEEAKNAMIPTMILQPIVENALQHGIKTRGEKSEVRIHAYKQDNKLNITVKDNGEGRARRRSRPFRRTMRSLPGSREVLGLPM